MKSVLVIGGLLLGLTGTQAMAQVCSGTALSVTQLSQLLPSRYACAGPGAWPNVTWNELHSGAPGSFAGTVTDFKKGPGDPVDPTKVVGSYSISNNVGLKAGQVTYNYGDPGGPYTYKVLANLGTTYPNAGHYSFCTLSGGRNINVTVGLFTAHGGCP